MLPACTAVPGALVGHRQDGTRSHPGRACGGGGGRSRPGAGLACGAMTTAVFVHGNPETAAVWEPLLAVL
ncbi:MAG TPA: hypothetical protein VMB82_12710, partial [Acidimicrobiales bacterium]|nr:hypothetical protein [Acidimicrobiales bacterium]